MRADLRGFRDSLAGVRQQRQWRLDEGAAKAAGLQSQLILAERACEESSKRLAEASARASADWHKRLDPATQSGLLAHLADLQAQGLGLAAEAQQLRDALAETRRIVAQRQQDLEVLDRYRKDLLVDYELAQARTCAAAADADWLSRTAAGRGKS